MVKPVRSKRTEGWCDETPLSPSRSSPSATAARCVCLDENAETEGSNAAQVIPPGGDAGEATPTPNLVRGEDCEYFPGRVLALTRRVRSTAPSIRPRARAARTPSISNTSTPSPDATRTTSGPPDRLGRWLTSTGRSWKVSGLTTMESLQGLRLFDSGEIVFGTMMNRAYLRGVEVPDGGFVGGDGDTGTINEAGWTSLQLLCRSISQRRLRRLRIQRRVDVARIGMDVVRGGRATTAPAALAQATERGRHVRYPRALRVQRPMSLARAQASRASTGPPPVSWGHRPARRGAPHRRRGRRQPDVYIVRQPDEERAHGRLGRFRLPRHGRCGSVGTVRHYRDGSPLAEIVLGVSSASASFARCGARLRRISGPSGKRPWSFTMTAATWSRVKIAGLGKRRPTLNTDLDAVAASRMDRRRRRHSFA